MKAEFTASIQRIVVFLFVILYTFPAIAQISEATRQSNQILRDQQDRREEDRMRAESMRPPSKIEMPAPAAPTGQGEGCWDVSSIAITGATHMPVRQQKKITQKYNGKCLGVAEVQNLLSDITAYYIEKGYSTTRAYLPAQDLTTKTLRIDVLEGTVGKVRLQEGDKGSLNLRGAFPGLEGNTMNLRDFEQGLDQLNRLSSNNASIDVAPGALPGESLVTIRNDPGHRWHLNADVDNYGTRSTGALQSSATGSLDNLFGLNDLWSVTGRRSGDPDAWSDKFSNALNGFVSIPYGYSLLTMGYSHSNYKSELVTPGPTLELKGNSSSGFVALDHTIYRTQTDKLTFSGTLTVKKQENSIAGSILSSSSRPLTVLDLGPNYSTNLFGGTCSVGLTWSQGLKILGAYEDPSGTPDNVPHAQFSKQSLTASWYRPFTVAEQNLSWSSALTAQRSSKTLYGTEQISAGGLYTVRGFYDQSAANDDGAFIRNDLSLQKQKTLMGHDFNFRPYIALDAGDISGPTGSTHGTLVGGGVGLSISAANFSFELFTGLPIVQPDSFNDEGFHTFARASVTF